MTKDKQTPQVNEIEANVLGSIIVNEKLYNYVETDFSAELFYKENHFTIAQIIISLKNRNMPVDLISIFQEAKKLGKTELIGGAYYLSELCNQAINVNLEYNVKILQQYYIRRRAIEISHELINKSYDDTSDVFSLIDQSEKGITELTSKIITSKVITSSDLAIQTNNRNNLIRTQGGITGIKSGFADMDKLIGGWQKSDLIILAARPSMGKTSLATQLLMNPAIRQGKPTAIFSLEMSNEQLYIRMKSQLSGIELYKFTKYGLNEHEVASCDTACKDLYHAQIYFDDCGGMTIFDLKNKARKLKRDKGIELLIIDYLQLITTTKKSNNREQEVAQISRELKTIAKELEISIICLSQMSRQVESRSDKKPIMSDLRESGSIEQDADLVMFIYRPEYYGIMQDASGNSTEGKAAIMVCKNRNGATGDVILDWVPSRTMFADVNKNSYVDNSDVF
jgi:replicative DNA helicase